jgi:hypothetical protein
LLGRLRDLVLDGRAALRRVVRHCDIVVSGVIDGRIFKGLGAVFKVSFK